MILVVHVEISRYLENLREEGLVNKVYHVECLNISAALRDNSQKIKWSHVNLKKGVW